MPPHVKNFVRTDECWWDEKNIESGMLLVLMFRNIPRNYLINCRCHIQSREQASLCKGEGVLVDIRNGR